MQRKLIFNFAGRFSLVIGSFAGASLSAQQVDPHTATRASAVRAAPANGATPTQPLGQIAKGATVDVIARDRDWVRIRLEGWVRESDLIVSDSTLRPLSAADVRSDPAGSAGKLVRWDVEAVALRTADPLRTGLQAGEQYLLALGPGVEKTLVYIAVPASLLSSVRSLPALAPVTVTARVRNGRSEPAGVPILDLQSLTRH
ncbi:MAG TPA: hypothetical protein VM939_11170 [Gemmatimonadaceae bacterium]|nr:hypothetical protein [Gemmatimonadaceae bacterium]